MKSTVVSFDWIASSGSLKLTEINDLYTDPELYNSIKL